MSLLTPSNCSRDRDWPGMGGILTAAWMSISDFLSAWKINIACLFIFTLDISMISQIDTVLYLITQTTWSLKPGIRKSAVERRRTMSAVLV